MFWQFTNDEWLKKLNDKEWRVYWQVIMLIHDRSDGGRITHSWHTLAYLLGLKRKNTTVFRILKKFHEAGKIVWENHEEFASRIPEELRDTLEIDPEVGVSEQGTIPKWKMSKGGLIRDKVSLFSPQVVEMLKQEMSRIRGKFYSPYKPCCYYPECKFRRSIGECDRCSDPSLAERRLREALSVPQD